MGQAGTQLAPKGSFLIKCSKIILLHFIKKLPFGAGDGGVVMMSWDAHTFDMCGSMERRALRYSSRPLRRFSEI